MFVECSRRGKALQKVDKCQDIEENEFDQLLGCVPFVICVCKLTSCLALLMFSSFLQRNSATIEMGYADSLQLFQ